MKGNNQLVKSLVEKAGAHLCDEVLYFLDGQEGELDWYLALLDAEEGGDRRILRLARGVLIELEVYKSVSEEDLAGMVSTGRKYDFQLKGVKYCFSEHLENDEH